MMRRIAPALALLMAMAAGAQTAKAPKIEKADFKDPGKVAYRFAKGQTESYLTETVTDTKTAVQVMGQEMNINAKGTTRQYMTIKVLDDAVPTKAEVSTEHMQMKQSVDGGMFAMEITVDDKKIKATMGDQVLVDSEGGVSNPMIEQFTTGLEVLGKKAIVLIEPDGRIGSKIEGDPEAAKYLRNLPDQTVFAIVWKQLEGLKPGDTWDIESELRTMQQLELAKPIKLKTTYKVVGGASVDGVECIEIESRSVVKATDVEAITKQAGQEMKMKLASMAWEMTGRAFYDPAKNRSVYGTTKGTVEIEGSMDVDQAGKTDVKVIVDLNGTVRLNAPWK
ncbi:MAG: hypothetical protein GX446_15180 [Chthonomonadales bacterium]|nr:hypothetical protein [Chthonomonadales bacterium]